jgi:hypothetical protein
MALHAAADTTHAPTPLSPVSTLLQQLGLTRDDLVRRSEDMRDYLADGRLAFVPPPPSRPAPPPRRPSTPIKAEAEPDPLPPHTQSSPGPVRMSAGSMERVIERKRRQAKRERRRKASGSGPSPSPSRSPSPTLETGLYASPMRICAAEATPTQASALSKARCCTMTDKALMLYSTITARLAGEWTWIRHRLGRWVRHGSSFL